MLRCWFGGCGGGAHGGINGHPFEFMTVVKPNGFVKIYAICGVKAHDRWAWTLSKVICKQSENKEKVVKTFVVDDKLVNRLF